MGARRRLFCAVVATLAVSVVAACGGGGSQGANTTDGGPPADGPSGGGFDGAIPAAGTATLSGPQAFPVGSARMGSSLIGGCGSQNDAGLLATLSILISSQGLPSLLCATDGGIPDGGPGDWIDIEIGTSQAAQGAPITMALGPGVYVIGNEAQNDPDLCMLPNGSNAFLQLLTPSGYDAQAIAISGTVTIDTLTPSTVTGTFSVLMGGPYGATDASPPPSLSGAFNATKCP
jgi:hypothetical protein